MITLKTITTIELSSICNLACKYCINRLLVKHSVRKAGIMEDDIFERTLHWLKILCFQGTQREVNLNGNGESTLDPQLIERIKKIREIVGDRQIMFCTNGVNMSVKLAMDLRASGIDRVDISPHSPWHARRAAQQYGG